jgi:hypothetical protein
VANGGDADGLIILGQLIKDPISTNPQRVQTAQSASERMPSSRFALKQAQRILNRIDQRPVEFEQLTPSSTGEDEPGQRSAGGRSALGKLAAKVSEGNRFVALDLGEAGLQGSEGIGVGENLGGLL